MKLSETMPAGYSRMMQERTEMNREIKKMAKRNTDRHLEERKVRTMGPSKETIRRLKMKKVQLESVNEGVKQQEGQVLVKRK